MQSRFDSGENAIHPDGLSVLDHGIKNDEYDLEPDEVPEDVVATKAEPESDDRRIVGFTSTRGTLDDNVASHSSPVVEQARQISPQCLNPASRAPCEA